MQETAVFKLSCCLWFLARDCRGSYITEPHLVLVYWEFIFPGIHVTLSAGSDSGLLQKVVSGKEGCCFQWPAWLADHTPSALKRAENETLQVSATVPACRGKKGKVKDMVVVTIPMDWLGRQKLGNRETIGHAHAEKQSQKGNGKAATWEKSSVEEHVSGMQRDRRDFCICREKAERKKIPLEWVYLPWEWNMREEHTTRKRCSSLKEVKKRHWDWEWGGQTDKKMEVLYSLNIS